MKNEKEKKKFELGSSRRRTANHQFVVKGSMRSADVEVIDTGYDFENQIYMDKENRKRKRILFCLFIFVIISAIIAAAIVKTHQGSYPHARTNYRLDESFVINAPPEIVINACKAVAVVGNRVFIGQDGGLYPVMEFDTKGKFVTGWGAGELASVQGMFATQDYLWVVDVENHTVNQFSHGGELRRQFGTNGVSGPGTDPLQFDRPTDVIVDAAGIVYIADGEGENDRIVVLNPSYTIKTIIGESGSAAGQFNVPHQLALEPSTNRIWVADERNNRVQVFDLDWYAYVGEWTASTGCDFYLPKGLAIDTDSSSVFVSTTSASGIPGDLIEIPAPRITNPLDFGNCAESDRWPAAEFYYHKLAYTSRNIYAVNPFDGTCVVRYYND